MTDTNQTLDLDADRGRLLSHLVDLNARIADLTAEAEAVKAELRALPAGDYSLNGRPALRIIPNRRFDATKGAGLLSVQQREAALVVSYDATKVKQHLTGVEIDECMVEVGKPKIVVL